MENFIGIPLWIASLTLPYILFIVGNSLHKFKTTMLRAVIAVGGGWIFMLVYGVAINSINLSMVRSQSDFEAIYNGDGAVVAFAAVLGWVLPAIVVTLAWFIHGLVIPRWLGQHPGTNEQK